MARGESNKKAHGLIQATTKNKNRQLQVGYIPNRE